MNVEELLAERRIHSRQEVRLAAKYFVFNKSVVATACTVINLSRSGLAIELDGHASIDVGDRIFVEVSNPDAFEQVNLKGTVRRIEKNQRVLGIEFSVPLDEFTVIKYG